MPIGFLYRPQAANARCLRHVRSSQARPAWRDAGSRAEPGRFPCPAPSRRVERADYHAASYDPARRDVADAWVLGPSICSATRLRDSTLLHAHAAHYTLPELRLTQAA